MGSTQSTWGVRTRHSKMAQIISLVFALVILCGHINSLNCLTVNQLHGKYYEIFSRAYNRNAASHLWASYIIERSSSMTRAEILNLFGGFCPVSGSPVSPSPGRIWQRVPVQKAGNSSEVVTGDIYVCCWPCVCDTMEHVRTDQVNINTRNGVEAFDALVIGNPCVHPERIPRRAPEVYCSSSGELVGAKLSNLGHIVIGLIQEGQTRGAYYSADMIKERCESRKSSGYRSGMGTIFVDVASINPI